MSLVRDASPTQNRFACAFRLKPGTNQYRPCWRHQPFCPEPRAKHSAGPLFFHCFFCPRPCFSARECPRAVFSCPRPGFFCPFLPAPRFSCPRNRARIARASAHPAPTQSMPCVSVTGRVGISRKPLRQHIQSAGACVYWRARIDKCMASGTPADIQTYSASSLLINRVCRQPTTRGPFT